METSVMMPWYKWLFCASMSGFCTVILACTAWASRNLGIFSIMALPVLTCATLFMLVATAVALASMFGWHP